LGTALVAYKDALSSALASAKEAVNKAETATEKRFDGVNEFRNTLSDQQKNLIPRLEAENKFSTLDRDIAMLQLEIRSLREYRVERRATGQGAKNIWGFVAGLVGVLVGIAGIIIAIIKTV